MSYPSTRHRPVDAGQQWGNPVGVDVGIDVGVGFGLGLGSESGCVGDTSDDADLTILRHLIVRMQLSYHLTSSDSVNATILPSHVIWHTHASCRGIGYAGRGGLEGT